MRDKVIANLNKAGLPEAMFSGQGDISKIVGGYFSKEGKEVFEKYFSEPHADEFYEQLMDIVRNRGKQAEKHDSDSSTLLTTQFDRHINSDSQPAGSAAEEAERHTRKQDEDRKRRGV